ncbi:hypothetical protein [Sessilibacter corallicola]|uniref:hypothetical protein n=1 Tax=Sessilibacter corallicola TaxID=2904075 RepID=UPI001E405A8F|nr:hypothetical protein [Sessilibacter corallicola]MCE2029299.1 hypothetical protein [Sessilibacter corallicola]
MNNRDAFSQCRAIENLMHATLAFDECGMVEKENYLSELESFSQIKVKLGSLNITGEALADVDPKIKETLDNTFKKYQSIISGVNV